MPRPRRRGPRRGPDVGRARDTARTLDGERDDAVGSWRSSFLRAPYLRNALVCCGMLLETFETACTWDAFDELHASVTETVDDALQRICGGGWVTCRFTHVYPDGPAPYFSITAPGRIGSELAMWDEIKAAASEVLLAAGGTITHHHAVGRDHDPWYRRQRPAGVRSGPGRRQGRARPRRRPQPGGHRVSGATYVVEAYNTATQSTNKIHDDDVARTYGFRGGLVPGVDVYAYLTHVPAERWGRGVARPRLDHGPLRQAGLRRTRRDGHGDRGRRRPRPRRRRRRRHGLRDAPERPGTRSSATARAPDAAALPVERPPASPDVAARRARCSAR